MKLGLSEYVDCAHFLPGHPKCGQLHGHTYKVDLEIEGDHSKGMIVDFADLRAQVRAVLQEFDHRNWNDVLEYPSVENICALLHGRLAGRLTFPFKIRIWEGHGKFAEL